MLSYRGPLSRCYLVLQLVFTGGLDTYIDASKDPGYNEFYLLCFLIYGASEVSLRYHLTMKHSLRISNY